MADLAFTVRLKRNNRCIEIKAKRGQTYSCVPGSSCTDSMEAERCRRPFSTPNWIRWSLQRCWSTPPNWLPYPFGGRGSVQQISVHELNVTSRHDVKKKMNTAMLTRSYNPHLCTSPYSSPLISRTRARKKKAYDTRYSQAVTHPSTNRARRCLTSVIGRELVYSTWYGRKRWSSRWMCTPWITGTISMSLNWFNERAIEVLCGSRWLRMSTRSPTRLNFRRRRRAVVKVATSILPPVSEQDTIEQTQAQDLSSFDHHRGECSVRFHGCK